MTKESNYFENIVTVFLALLLLGIAAWPASAQATGRVTGTVTDAYSHAPISGATVTVGGITANTDYSGSYTIEIAAGTYTVTASANGYNIASTSVTVTPGATATPYLVLKPISASETPSLAPSAPSLGVPSTPTVTGTGESPGFGILEAVVVLVLLIVGMRIQKKR